MGPRHIFERVLAQARAGVTRRRGAIGVAMLLATALVACGGAGMPTSFMPASAQPTVDFAERTPSPECFNPPPEVRAVILQTDPLACYGGADLTFDAYVTGVGAIDCPGGLQPSWFVCSAWVALASPDVAPRAAIVLAATSRPGWETMFAALHPDVALDHSDILDHTARISGHFDDPAAQTCHYDPWEFPFGDDPPTTEETAEGCRHVFVITGVDTVTSSVDAPH